MQWRQRLSTVGVGDYQDLYLLGNSKQLPPAAPCKDIRYAPQHPTQPSAGAVIPFVFMILFSFDIRLFGQGNIIDSHVFPFNSTHLCRVTRIGHDLHQSAPHLRGRLHPILINLRIPPVEIGEATESRRNIHSARTSVKCNKSLCILYCNCLLVWDTATS
jgi:hypothetical protein